MDVAALLDKLIGFLPTDWQAKLKESRKALVAGLGALLGLLALVGRFGFLVPPNLKQPLAIAVSVLTAALTWLTPNEPPVVVDTSGA